MPSDISSRKEDHLTLCSTDEVAFRSQTTLLEHVRLIHQSLPELAMDEVDTSVSLFGKRLSAPIFIASMTGGTERAAEINRELAKVADARGYGFGLGSQRAMHRKPETAWTYRVRKDAPNVLLMGNIGVVQAREWKTEIVQTMLGDIGADGLFIHMNPAMELVQPEGDRDFRGGIETFARYVRELELPVVAKETGNGISESVARKLVSAGVRHVDVSGAGGTSWVGVETLRAQAGARQRALGEALWDWGVPTAASLIYTTRVGLKSIATGGIKTGSDVARAIALGASAAGIARPVLQAFERGGAEGVMSYLDGVEAELRAIMLLTGSRTLAELQSAPKILGGDLRAWAEASS